MLKRVALCHEVDTLLHGFLCDIYVLLTDQLHCHKCAQKAALGQGISSSIALALTSRAWPYKLSLSLVLLWHGM